MRSSKSKPRIVWQLLIGGMLGSIPGILLLCFGIFRVGTVALLFGAFNGVLLTLPGVSAGRVFRFFIAYHIHGMIPFVGDRIYDWGDDKDDSPADLESSVRFLMWVSAPHVQRRRGWLVFIGLLVGVTAGVHITTNDLSLEREGGTGLMVPFRKSPESHVSQAVAATCVCGLWGAAAASMLASAAYRRPVVVALGLSGVWSALVGWGADLESGALGLVPFIIMMTSIALCIAFFVPIYFFVTFIASGIGPEDFDSVFKQDALNEEEAG